MLKELSKTLSQNKRAFGLILVGSATWTLTMIKSGLPTQWGIGFWGANGHDGIWHLALINSLARGSLAMPTFSGYGLQNYHIGFDLLIAMLTKLGIGASLWYFQILPIVFALFTGILTYVLVLEWRKSHQAALWSTFFVYFGGSFGWIVTLIRGQGIGGESMFWSQQAISSLINPPFAFSIIVLLLIAIYLQRYLFSKKIVQLLIVTILMGILIEVKAYAAVLGLGALFLVATIYLLKDKKPQLLYAFVGSCLISAILFIFLSRSTGNVFIFQPFWFLETMLSISDRFNWPKLYEAIINWRAAHLWYKAVVGYLVAFFIFILGNLGLRVISVLPLGSRMKTKSLKIVDVFLILILIGGVVIPVFFVQVGTAWNTIQFFYYSLFVAALYSGAAIDSLTEKISGKYRKIFGSLIVLLTIPTSVSTLLTVYIPPRPPGSLPVEEVEGLNFLSKLPPGIVLTYPFDKLKADEAVINPPRPLYLYDSTAYVSAFSNHPVFLEDEVNLTIMNYQWKERRDLITKFYSSLDQDFERNFLDTNNISYIYWIKPQRAALGESQLGLSKVFENKKVEIYKVSH